MNKETNIREEEIILAPPAELFDEAKRISQDTTHDEKYPFALQYDTNQKEFLLSMLKMAGATVENDDENNHLLSTMMNMTQLAFIKSLDCVERVKTDEGINPFLVENTTTLMPAHQAQQNSNVLETEMIEVHPDLVAHRTIATNLETEDIAEEGQGNDGITITSVNASSRSSSVNCPTNTDMAHAQEITVETLVSGNICCPGAEQWFKFTVPTSNKYTIYTAGSLDTIGTLTASYFSEPITIDDYAGRINFRIVKSLYAGYDYYIKVRAKNDATGRYTLMVTEDTLAEEVVIYPNRNDDIVVLEKGKTYELPRGDGYTFLNATNTENAPLSVKVNPTTTTDKRVYWGASSTPSDPVDINLTWYENNTAYQTITANTCGGTKLYAYDWFEHGKRDEVIVAVIPNGGSLVKATDISLDYTSLIMNIGAYQTIAATVSPGNATVQDVEWVSDNTDIATVNPYGLVKAIAPGTTRIRAKSMTGTPVVEAVCTVTVPAKSYYNIVNANINGTTEMVANINGVFLINLDNENNITLYSKSGSNEQVWMIDTISNSEDCYIRSYVDHEYGFNVDNDSNHNCNINKIIGNETNAAVHFLLQNDGSYKIKLAQHSNYYLTATDSNNGSNINWQPENSAKNQNWNLVSIDMEQLEAEKTEYHIIPYSDINHESKRALQVKMTTPNEGIYVNKTKRLENDEPLEVESFSYINKQKWLIKGTDTHCQIYTPHGNNYHLCKKSDAMVYVSNNDSYESFITIESHNESPDLVRIKLTNSNLYLTLTDSGIIWSSLSNNSTSQIWQIVAKPNDIHNGADTSTRLYNASLLDKDRTIRACKLGGEEFVGRYYADINELNSDNKILSVEEANSLHEHNIKIVSVYQDSANYASYFSASEGEKDATIALSLAKERNQPAGSAIYFSVDYDATNPNMASIKEYFSAIKSVFDTADVKYKIGVYGNGLTCRIIKDEEKYAEYSWLSHSIGHEEYPQYDFPDKYNIKQAEFVFYNNIQFDDNIAVGDDYGQW